MQKIPGKQKPSFEILRLFVLAFSLRKKQAAYWNTIFIFCEPHRPFDAEHQLTCSFFSGEMRNFQHTQLLAGLC
jgi:hypothetical protein